MKISAGVKRPDNSPWVIQPSAPVSAAFKDEFKSLAAWGPNCTSSRAVVGICSNNKEITNGMLCRITAVQSVKGQDTIPHDEGLNAKSRARKWEPSVWPCVSPLCCHQLTLAPTALLGRKNPLRCWVGLSLFKVSPFCFQLESPLPRASLSASYCFLSERCIRTRESLRQDRIYSWTMWNLS